MRERKRERKKNIILYLLFLMLLRKLKLFVENQELNVFQIPLRRLYALF